MTGKPQPASEGFVSFRDYNVWYRIVGLKVRTHTKNDCNYGSISRARASNTTHRRLTYNEIRRKFLTSSHTRAKYIGVFHQKEMEPPVTPDELD